MFPTCLDVTLERLSVLEKLPPLSDSLFRSQKMKFYQAELRFLRMFIWCNQDFDTKLHDDLDFIATSVAQLFKTNETNLFVFDDTEYNSLSRQIAGRRDKCHAEVRKYRYSEHLISSCSLKAVSCTCYETLEFLDSVHVNLNDLLNSVLRDKSEIEILEKLVFLLRNLVYYTPLGEENYDDANPKTNLIMMFLLFFSLRDSDANPKTDLIFQFNVQQWAHQAACLSLLRWITGTQDERIRRLHDDLQQRVNPCNRDFIKLCFQVIKAPKMKCEDRLLFGEFVSRFHLPWNEFSSVIGMLPCLEVLVLHVNSFSGEKWNVEDDEFPNIKYLKLKGLNIEEWNASEYSFPCLEKLVVFSCLKLIAIPPCFSEVVTLMSIDVHGCKKRVADSAIQIQNDQFDSGNESFEVSLYVLDI